MQNRAALIVLAQMLLAMPAFKAITKLSAVQFFAGSWQGTVHGRPGSGTVEGEYELAWNETFIRVRGKSVYPPQEKNPKGERDEKLGFLSCGSNRKKHGFRQFHWEGFVNQYVEESIAPDGKKMVFATEAIENIPAG
jgi:hypothetical protein